MTGARAIAVLASGSAVSLLANLVANKVYSVILGPSGLGLLGLLQSLLGLIGLVAGFGLSAGLVSLGAEAIAGRDLGKVAALKKAVWQIYFFSSLTLCLIVAGFWSKLSNFLPAEIPSWMGLVIMMSVFISVAAGLNIGFINAHHQVSELSKITAISNVLTALMGTALVVLFGARAVPIVIAILPLTQLILSTFYLPKNSASVNSSRGDIVWARTRLIRFGIPFTFSQLAGSAVQLGMPYLVLHELGQANVGYYKATILYSSAYIGFLVTALGQDYYPRLSGLKNQPNSFNATINSQQRLVLLISSPLIAFSVLFAPLLVTLVFSTSFLPMIDILRLQLFGDLFRVVSWTLGLAILAGSASRVYLASEVCGGLLLLGFSWWGIHSNGLAGLGIGYLTAYIAYLAVTGWIVNRKRTWEPSSRNIWLFLAAILIIILVKILPFYVGLPIALIWAGACGTELGRISFGPRP